MQCHTALAFVAIDKVPIRNAVSAKSRGCRVLERLEHRRCTGYSTSLENFEKRS